MQRGSDANHAETVLRKALMTLNSGSRLSVNQEHEYRDLLKLHSLSYIDEMVDEICKEERIPLSKKNEFTATLKGLHITQHQDAQNFGHSSSAHKTNCILLPNKQAAEGIIG